MKIKRIAIQNYRSIQSVDFEPSSLCALIGGNNAGKSNVLRAISLVLGDRWPSTRSIDERDFFGHREDIDLTIRVWFDEEQEVRGDVGDPSKFTGISFKVTRYKVKRGKNKKGDLRGEFVCIDDSGETVKVLKRPSATSKPYSAPAKVTSIIREALPAVFIDVDRSASYHLSGSQWSILGRLLRDVSSSLRADKKRYAEFRAKFDEVRMALRIPEFLELESTVIEQLRAHTGLDDVKVILDEVDPINIYKTFSVLFQDGETPNPVDADRMGSGVQSAVVISLLQAYRKLRRENAVLLFEEPELFLHPHGRRHLYRLLTELAEGGTQIIYTTHSQDLADLSRLDSVCLVAKDHDGTRVEAPDFSLLPGGWEDRLKIIKHFGGSRDEAMFADSVVLVEGVTEQAAIRMLATMMPEPLDLDRLNCSVVETNGKPAMPLLIGAMRAMSKRVLVIHDTDSDKEGEAATTESKRNKAIVEAAGEDGLVYSFDPHIEGACDVPSSRDKEARMRQFLTELAGWDDVPERLKGMMEAVKQLVYHSPDLRGADN